MGSYEIKLDMAQESHHQEYKDIEKIDMSEFERLTKQKIDVEEVERLLYHRIGTGEVPPFIKETKLEAYEPKLVGLGPYHHHKGEGALENIKGYKLKAVGRNAARIGEKQGCSVRQAIDLLFVKVEEKEEKIKTCYRSLMNFSSDVFVLDCCFVLEICYSIYFEEESHDTVFHYKSFNSGILLSIREDIMKLENQIPLFLLKDFLELQGINHDRHPILYVLFLPFMFAEKKAINNPQVLARQVPKLSEEEKEPIHLLEFLQHLIKKQLRDEQKTTAKDGLSCVGLVLRAFSLPCLLCLLLCHWASRVLRALKTETEESVYFAAVPRAEALDKGGLIIAPGSVVALKETCKGLQKNLELPPLTVNSLNEVILRNVIAYELTFIVEEPVVSSYAQFMNYLIHNANDVAILKKAGVVTCSLSSNSEVADMFNTLSVGASSTLIKEHHLVGEKLLQYHQSSVSRARTLRREFIHTYFSRPWYVVATLGAIVVVICTIAQTFMGSCLIILHQAEVDLLLLCVEVNYG